MTAFISEFRSMTFQCKSEISSSIQFSEINNYIEKNRMMAPQQHDATVQKSSDQILDSEQSRENQVSPISSLGGTSMESSSPVMPNAATPENINQSYELDRSQIADPSSDDSGSIANDLSGYQQQLQSPLEQLQCALGKDGMLGQKLHLSEYPGQKDDIRNSSNASLSSAEQSCIYYDSSDPYKCHLCTYASNSKQEFNIHMNSHFDHKCPFCDYTSRTEGRLKRHVKDFHSETPPESWAGTRVPHVELNGAEQSSMDDSVTSSNGKSRTYRCKQCDFIAYQKQDFWEHNKTHIKAEKLLSCPQCAFVTEYKHHLEYHLRNHYGSKPFKCPKCNYSCVNKSMLNSHMKSHSNIYQYRCANCTYATKYCHSLKLHLRKYDHKPATVLNVDGTPNPYPVIDVYGTRRGPRKQKRRSLEDSENNSVSSTAIVPSQPSMNYSPSVPLMPTNVPIMYPSQFFNGYPSNVYMKPHQSADHSSYSMGLPHLRVKHDNTVKCMLCDFVTDHQELLHKHMLFHAAAEHQDLAKLYGINPDSLLHFQDQMALNSYMQSQRHYMEHTQRTERKNFECHDIQKERPVNEYELEAKNIKHEENSMNYLKELKSASPRNESRSPRNELGKEISPPSYANNSHLLSPHGRQETDDDNERSVIVAHKSSPPAPTAEQMEIEVSDTDVKNTEHSPLDLSGPKPTDSTSKTKILKASLEKQSPELKNTSPNGIDASVCQRNRRKGKAFKIDHYIQYEDHTQNMKILRKENNEINNMEHHKNEREDVRVNFNKEMLPLFGQDIQRSTPVSTNGSNNLPTSQQPQNIAFQMTNSVNTLDRNGCRSSNRQSPHEDSSSVFSKNSSSVVVRETPQVTKERNLVQNHITLSESNFQTKGDVKNEQTNTVSAKQQDMFECEYCAMAFRECVMYTVHMGYHGFGDPFTCNMCGQKSKDKVEFFIHIARAAHV